MKTGNTRSPSRQSAAMPGRSGRLSKYIVAGILTVFLTGQLHAPPTAGTPGTWRYFQRSGPRAPRGRGYAKLITTGLLAAIMIAVLAGAFLYAAPSARAAPETLLSNTGRTTHANKYELDGTTTIFAQRFTTGTNTAGYTLSSIGIELAEIADTSNYYSRR